MTVAYFGYLGDNILFSVVRRENAKPVKQKALVNNMFNKVIRKIFIF